MFRTLARVGFLGGQLCWPVTHLSTPEVYADHSGPAYTKAITAPYCTRACLMMVVLAASGVPTASKSPTCMQEWRKWQP